METKGRVFGKAFDKKENNETRGRVFGEVSDDILIKDFIRNYTKPGEFLPDFSTDLRKVTLNDFKNPKSPFKSEPIPSMNHVPKVYTDAIKRKRYKNLELDTLGADITKAADAYKLVAEGWQDKGTMDKTKPIIENAYNRLKEYQDYVADYGDGGVDVSEQLNVYKTVLDSWDDIANNYGKFENADMYNNAVRRESMSLEELEEGLEEAKRIQSNIKVEKVISSSSPISSSKISNLQEELNEHLAQYGCKSVSELNDVIDGIKTKRKTVDNKKSLYQYQIEIDSLEHIVATAKELDKERLAAIRNRKYGGKTVYERDETLWEGYILAEGSVNLNKMNEDELETFARDKKINLNGCNNKAEKLATIKRAVAEWDAYYKVKYYIGQFGYATIEEAEKELGRLKGERNNLRAYQTTAGIVSDELTAVINPESSYYNEGAEKYIENGCKSDKYKKYKNSDEYSLLTKAELKTLAYYIGKDAETGGNETEVFLENIAETLETREGQEFYKANLKNKAVLEMLYAVPVGLDQFAGGIKNLFNTEDDYIPMNATQIAGQLAREELGNIKVPKWLGDWSAAGVAYDMISTTANMAPSILASAVANYIVPGSGVYVGGTLMGASAAGNAYQEAINSGMDASQARTYSTLIGVSEAALSATLSKVLGGKALTGKLETAISGIENGFCRFAANYGLAFASEGLEEGLQEVLTPLFENIALGYNKNGFDDIDWGEVAYSYLLGGFSGGTFEAGGTVVISGINKALHFANIKRTYNTYQNVAKLLDLGLSLSKESKAYKLAEKYNAESVKNGKISSNKVYNLVVAMENMTADSLKQLGESKNVSQVSAAVVKKLSGIELSLSEIELLSKSGYGQEVLNTTISKVETENNLQELVDNDIIENNQETGDVTDGRTYNQGTMGRENHVDTGGESQVRQSRQTVDGYVERGKGKVLGGMAGEAQRRIRINHTPNSSVIFTEGEADNTEGYKVYSAFANARMKVIYCEGPIERTVNGVTVSSTEAFTAPDGTVYVSSESSLPAKQTFDHEKVHVAQKTNNPSYNEYESILYEEIEFLSDSYKENATKINANQFNDKYDIEDIDTGPIFMREITAYINQFVLSDPAFAKETFGGMFGNWGAVVDAVNKFNTDMKADFTESANFMPENSSVNIQDSGNFGGNVQGDVLSVKRINQQRKHTTAKEQDFIKKVAKSLGVKVEFTHITPELLRSYGYEFNDGDILPDGYYDKDTDTVYIGYSVYNPVNFIFKHELTHFGEGTVQYNKFVKTVKKTKAFKNWLDKQIGFKKVDDLEEAYLFKIARERGYQLTDSGVLSEKDRAELHCEMIADFVGDCIFTEDTTMLDSMLSDLDYKERNAVLQYILDFLSYLKKKLAGNKDIVFEISRLEDNFNRMISEAVDTKKESLTEGGGELQFSIADLKSRDAEYKTYVDSWNRESAQRMVDEAAKKAGAILDESGNPLKLYRGTEGGQTVFAKEKTYKGKIYTIDNISIASNYGDKSGRTTEIEYQTTGEPTTYALYGFPNNMLTIDAQYGVWSDLVIPKELLKYSDGRYKATNAEIAEWAEVEGYDALRINNVRDGSFDAGNEIIFFDENLVKSADAITKDNNGEVIPLSQRFNQDKKDIRFSVPSGSQNRNNKTSEAGLDKPAFSMPKKENQKFSSKDLKFSFARVRDERLISKAENMEQKLISEGKGDDITRMRIWSKYGIIRDASGKWIFEIDDSDMKLSKFILDPKETDEPIVCKLSDVIEHPKLFEVFPQLTNVNFEIDFLNRSNSGYYNVEANTISLNIDLIEDIRQVERGEVSVKELGYNPHEEVRQIIVHEIQHVLQTVEDREPGASVEYWNQRFKRNRRLIDGSYLGESVTPEFAYWYTKGEYEAREATKRLNLTEEERREKTKTPKLGWGRTISSREIDTVASNKSYMSAVESGNIKQLQKMVDNAARANGYSERLYHQTGAEFTEFNTNNEAAGKYDWELPTGIFLKPSDSDIGLKGKKQMELFARVKNPLRFNDRDEARAYWNENIKGYKEASAEVVKVDVEYQRKYDEAIENTRRYLKKWRNENPGVDSREIYKDSEYLRINDIEDSIADEWEAASDKVSIKAKKLINNFMAKSHYDGIVIENDQGAGKRRTKSYIVFDSAQLKSAAPITYDNTGAVISLSQRFDPIKKDIRFSMLRETFDLLDSFEKGEITKAEYQEAMNKYWDDVIAEVQDTEWAKQLELIGLTEPSDQEIYRDPTDEENNDAIFGKRKNAKQRHILDVAKKLDSGIKVVFVNANAPVLSGQKGVYMRESNTIYLSESNLAVDSYYQVFKHELIHRLESKGAYKGFKNYLFKHSVAFEKYARAQLGKDFKGTREEALQELAQHYIDKVQKGGFSEKYKKSFNEEAAQREMVADFISEVLFKGDRADVAQSLAEGDIDFILDIEDTLAEFEKLNDTDRNWFQKIVDWVRDLIASLKGVKQNERLVKDLEYIEQRLSRVLDSRDTKKAAKNSGGIMYCFREKTPNVFNPKGVSLNEQLEDAYETSDSFDQRYVYVGIFSKDFAELLKKNNINLHNYPIAMNYRDAYLSMRSKETGKYHGEGINYHNLGIDGLRGALESFKNPQHIMKSKKDGKIELALQTVDKKGNSILSIIAVNTVTLNGNKMLNAHIVTSVYGKRNIENYISKARNEGRIIEPNKEEFSQGTPQVQYEGSINENSSNDIILNPESDVKDIISEEGENYSETDEKSESSFSLGSPAQQMRENRKRYESGEITQEEYQEETDNLWGKANETYGMFETGENANAPIATPKAVADDKPTERFTRTIIETGKLTDEMLEGMEEKVLLGGFSYKMVSDESAQKKADSAVLNGTAEDIWEETVNGDKITKNKMAIGERLLKDAIEKGDVLNVLKLSSELADIFTRAGQVVQAARLLKKMTGAGRLVSLQRTVKTLNKDMRKKHGEDSPPIKISEGAARRLAEAKTQDGIEHAYQEAMQEVAEQMPVTFLDKWNAWRYFAMLSNPKTHIRNVVGNAIFVPATRIRYFLAAVGEQTVSRDKRTKAIAIKKEYRDFAKKDGKDAGVKNLLKGNKYDDKSALREKQRIFKTEVLEFLTRFNSNALEAEDMLFKNKHYIHALSGFLQARGIDLKNVSQEVLDEARIYAVNEAKKATFNDESALANWVQNFGNKNFATNIMVEGVLPFKRTPINIVKRGIEYSPLGLTKTLTKGLYDVKKGKITVTEFIDGLASGLTGTGIMLAGMFLANLGYITGGEDDDEKSQFEKWLGKQEYAVEILGKSYTVDWAAPANIPFFIGVEIVNAINEGEDFSFSKFGNAVWNSLEPITNLSMLSGMQSVIESARYAEPSQTLSAIASDAITSYAMQGLPSLLGAVGRTIDPTQRSWYTDKNDKWLDSTAQAVKNNIQSKVPGLSYTQIPKIDMWGREVSRGGVGERVLENFVSPGYYSKIEVTETSEELKRIFNKTDIDVFPNIAAKSFDIDGKTKYLTAGEYVTYAKAKGSYSLDYVKEFMDSAAYKKLTDEERADVIQSLYEYSNAKAKTTVSDYDLMKRYKTVTNWERNGNSAVDYYISRAISK